MSLTFSNSDRWFRCPASEHPHSSSGGEETTGTDDQNEGRAAAWVAACVIEGDASEAAELIGRVSPHGWTITPDMTRYVQGYIDTVRSYGPHVVVERDLSLFNGLVNGRPDAHVTSIDNVLHIFELKYGYRVIEPDESIQLKLGARALHSGEPYIRLHIYQPRAYHPAGVHRSHMITRSDLEAFTVQAFQAVNATLTTPEIARPGAHCTYCPRRTACATLQNNIAGMFEALAVPEIRDRALTAEELTERYKILKRAQGFIKAAMSGVQGELESRVKGHEYMPGFYMGEKHARERQWNTTATMLKLKFGTDVEKTVLKTPVEMEREGHDVSGLTTRPFVGHELKEWNSNDLKRWFKD